MNILLWVLQIILALHTIIGAVWKFSNPEQTVSSLKAIPHGVWLAMGVIEIFCGLCLILPAFNKRLTILVPIAAVCIAVEMLSFPGCLFIPMKPITAIWFIGLSLLSYARLLPTAGLY